MTLSELSVEYEKSAELITQRLRILRETERHCTDAFWICGRCSSSAATCKN